MSKDEILESIASMSVLDLSELVKAIEEKFGVSASVAVAAVAAPAAGSAAPAAVTEEQTEFTVNLKSAPAADKKIGVIKVVREITGLGLKEAKDLVEAAPKAVKENVAKSEAEAIKKKLEEAGAEAEIK